MGTTLFGMNLIVTEPDRAVGWDEDNEIPIGNWFVGLVASGTFTRDNEPREVVRTDIVKIPLVFKVELSEACTVNVNMPAWFAVPVIAPELERVSPSGKD